MRAVPAHATRCITNLLGNSQCLSTTTLDEFPASVLWATLFHHWQRAVGNFDACDENQFAAAITGALLALLERVPTLAHKLGAAADFDLCSLVDIAAAGSSLARAHGLSLLAAIGPHLCSMDHMIAVGTAAITAVVDARQPIVTLISALELVYDVFGSDNPTVLQAAQRLGFAAKLASVCSFVEQRLQEAIHASSATDPRKHIQSRGQAGGQIVDNDRLEAAIANLGAFVDYALVSLQ